MQPQYVEGVCISSECLTYGFHEFREVGFELFLELCQLYGLSIV